MWFKLFAKANLPFLYLYSAFLALGGVLLFIYTKDFLIIAVNSRYSAFGDIFFKYYTHVGDGKTYICLTILTFLFFSKYKALILGFSYACTSLPVQILKNFVFAENFRPRAFFWLDSHRLHFVEGVEILSAKSFPSGHTASAFSMFLVLSYFSKNKFLSATCFLAAFLVGYSRMYLAAHFFADVYAGSIFGVVMSSSVIFFLENVFMLNEKYNLKNGLLSKS